MKLAIASVLAALVATARPVAAEREELAWTMTAISSDGTRALLVELAGTERKLRHYRVVTTERDTKLSEASYQLLYQRQPRKDELDSIAAQLAGFALDTGSGFAVAPQTKSGTTVIAFEAPGGIYRATLAAKGSTTSADAKPVIPDGIAPWYTPDGALIARTAAGLVVVAHPLAKPSLAEHTAGDPADRAFASDGTRARIVARPDADHTCVAEIELAAPYRARETYCATGRWTVVLSPAGTWAALSDGKTIRTVELATKKLAYDGPIGTMPPAAISDRGVAIIPGFPLVVIDSATKAVRDVAKNLGSDLRFASPTKLAYARYGRVAVEDTTTWKREPHK